MVLDQQTNTIQKGGYAISKDTVVEARNPEKGTQDNLTDLLREGAKRLIIEAVDAESSATLAEFDDTRTRQVTGMWFARVTFPKRRADIQGRVDIRPGIKHLHDATELTGHERGVTENSATVPQHGAPLPFPERRFSF